MFGWRQADGGGLIHACMEGFTPALLDYLIDVLKFPVDQCDEVRARLM
jgi:hypothetical protein